MRGKPITLKRARTLRRAMSLPEVVLWQELRGGKLADLHFRRQHPLGPYIADFYCASARLVVEVDGEIHTHPGQERHDEARDRWMVAEGIRVFRVPAPDVLDDEGLSGVLTEIEKLAAGPDPSALAPAPLPAFGRTPPASQGENN